MQWWAGRPGEGKGVSREGSWAAPGLTKAGAQGEAPLLIRADNQWWGLCRPRVYQPLSGNVRMRASPMEEGKQWEWRLGFTQDFILQVGTWRSPFPSLPDPNLSVAPYFGLLALWAHLLQFWWLPPVLLISDLSPLQVPGPPHLPLPSPTAPGPVVGLPGKQPGNGAWLENQVGKFPSVS